jgi:acyl-lipid omega-6 desaturase (Delta-12 desaturase)
MVRTSFGRRVLRQTNRFAKEDRFRSWRCLLSTLGPLTVILTITGLPIHFVYRLPASLLAGLLFVRLFVIYHDHMHGAIMKNSFLGGFILRLWGLLALTPPSIWKETHDHHHRNNARSLGMVNVGSFPVLTTTEYEAAGFKKRFLYMASRHPLVIATGYLTVFLFGFCIQPLLLNPRRHVDGAVSTVVHAAMLTVLFLVRPDVALLAVIIPFSVGAALGSYLFYAQHNFPAAEIRTGSEWDYVFAALHSSSFMSMNPVLRWFSANIGFHHVHHLNSRIPFYRLPETMAALKELQSPGRTSLKPKDVWKCLRLKLWDAERNRLVSFRENRKRRASLAVTPVV